MCRVTKTHTEQILFSFCELAEYHKLQHIKLSQS